jgi:hypothetical protein
MLSPEKSKEMTERLYSKFAVEKKQADRSLNGFTHLRINNRLLRNIGG